MLPSRLLLAAAARGLSPPHTLSMPCTPRRSGLTPLLMGAVVSSSLMGALAASVAVLLQGDGMGRRQELLGAAGLYGRKGITNKVVQVHGIHLLHPEDPCICPK